MCTVNCACVQAECLFYSASLVICFDYGYSGQNLSVVMKTDYVMNYYAVPTHLYVSQQNTDSLSIAVHQVCYIKCFILHSIGSPLWGQDVPLASRRAQPIQ